MTRKNGGVQVGGCASGVSSYRMDKVLRAATKELIGAYPVRPTKKQPIKIKIGGEPEFAELHYKAKLERALIPAGVGGCQPDGGIIFCGDEPLMSNEGKTQNKTGNAIERAAKNHCILDHVYPFMSQLTFCAGPGTEIGGPIHNYALQFLAITNPNNRGLNHFHPGGVSFFIVDEEIVTADEIKNYLRPILRVILADPQRLDNAFLCRFHQGRIQNIRGSQRSYSLEELSEVA